MKSRFKRYCMLALTILVCLNISGCFAPKKTKGSKKTKRYKLEQDVGPHHTEHVPDLSRIPNAIPRAEPHSKIGNPKTYTVFNKTYIVLPSSKGYKEKGTASWYGKKFHGYHTSNGEVYDMYGMSGAHKTLPLPTYAKVTNLENGKHVIVKINDRGPFHDDRLIDLSYAAASKLGILHKGTARVELRALDPSERTSQTYFKVGSFDVEQNAKKLAARIEKIMPGKKSMITIGHSKTKNGKKYHVRVGPLDNETEIAKFTNTLIRNKMPKPTHIRH